ncbi:MAG: threonylcarbamoyl-AMP synthase [Nitrosomonas sp.]|nr:threonylcarbamoyl-AMP synthase [Nitrosomonas sp.]MCW5607628.1 threonylcarbamoyl-AMP synthase [Nitrosomonas sp.]
MSYKTNSDTIQFDQEQRNQISTAAAILDNGGIVAFPTETVYGLGADATNPAAVRKIYDIKQRPADHPLILHIGDIARMEHWSQDIPESAWMLAERFWPGPLTLILKRSRHVPDCVTGGQDTVGIRMPAHAIALALLNAIRPEKAIAAPSANLYGKISPTTSAHVQATLAGKVDMILDGGPCAIGLESTIVHVDHQTVSILRPGGIAVSAIESALNQSVILTHHNSRQTIRVSGALPAHYAPSTPLRLHTQAEIYKLALELAEQHFQIAVITWSDIDPRLFSTPEIRHIAMPPDPVEYGKQLYAVLHRCDRIGLDFILMESPPQKPAWLAVADRLQRASQAYLKT